MTAKCKADQHQPKQIGPDRGFFSSVAVHPYTDENPAAHGNICITQECTVCGARRSVNINGQHDEVSPWGPTAQERSARERKQATEEKTEREKQLRKLAREAYKVKILDCDTKRQNVHVQVGDQPAKWLHVESIREAAEQYDDGDGLVQVYTGMLLMARDALARRSRDMEPPR